MVQQCEASKDNFPTLFGLLLSPLSLSGTKVEKVISAEVGWGKLVNLPQVEPQCLWTSESFDREQRGIKGVLTPFSVFLLKSSEISVSLEMIL